MQSIQIIFVLELYNEHAVKKSKMFIEISEMITDIVSKPQEFGSLRRSTRNSVLRLS